jgi:ADP-heptose:LPS heptosyltransferase
LTKFLILRFSSIGDIVLTTPVVRCIKQQYPNAEIHYFTKPAFASILQANPYIDKVHVLDEALLKKTTSLKKIGFDYVIDLHNNLRTRIIKSVLDVPAFSFDKLNIEKSQLVKLGVNSLPPIHIVDRYLATLSSFNVVNDGKGLDFFIPAETVLPDALQHIAQQAFVTIAVGAQHATKRLPTDKLIELCKLIKHPIVLLGGKEDVATGKQIEQAVGTHVHNYCGALSLQQSALAVKQSIVLITHDTGLMHIAAALQKSTISVWGNTVPEFGMTAYYGNQPVPNAIFEVKQLSCRPCSKIGFHQCPKQHFNCMNLQPIEAIAAHVNSI